VAWDYCVLAESTVTSVSVQVDSRSVADSVRIYYNGVYLLALPSPWIMAIVCLLAVMFIAFLCCKWCVRGRRALVLFGDYEKVKQIDNGFDESEANELNVVSE